MFENKHKSISGPMLCGIVETSKEENFSKRVYEYELNAEIGLV